MPGKKPTGRRTGRPNDSLSDRTKKLIALLDSKWPGWHPVGQMADIANDPNEATGTRLNAAKEVAKYVAPQLKALDLNGLVSTENVVRIIDLSGSTGSVQETKVDVRVKPSKPRKRRK